MVNRSTPPIEETTTSVARYLLELDKTFQFAWATTYVALIVAILAFADLYWYIRFGSYVLHPSLDIFIAIAAFSMIAVSAVSIHSIRQYIKSSAQKLLNG
jgi:hypothetical protein